MCITSFWLRVYYNLAQFELNASELDDIAHRALVPKESQRMVRVCEEEL